MKNQTLAAHVGRRVALGTVTIVLVLSAADRGRAASSTPVAWAATQTNAARGQAAPQKAEPQKPNQPRVPWWKDPAVVKELSLTTDQSAKIDALWRKRETEMQAVAKEYERQKAELDRLMAERKVGVDVIGVQHDRVEARRTTLAKSRTIMIYEFSLVLTPEQNAALKKYFDRIRRERR